MKTSLINKDQSFINIVGRAISNGFELDRYTSIEETLIEAEDYLINNLPVDKREYCEVLQHTRTQHVEYSDGLGTHYHSDGEIIDWQIYKNAQPNEQYVYATIVTVKGEIVELYENLNLTL